jgi:hypothetical protein
MIETPLVETSCFHSVPVAERKAAGVRDQMTISWAAIAWSRSTLMFPM